MVDPLRLLRECTINGTPIFVDGSDLVFPSQHNSTLRFPLAKETSFRSRKGKEGVYSLGSIWFLLQHDGTSHFDYIKECKNKNFLPPVAFTDKNDIIKWLKGSSDAIPLEVVTTDMGGGGGGTIDAAHPPPSIDLPLSKRQKRDTDIDVSTAATSSTTTINTTTTITTTAPGAAMSPTRTDFNRSNELELSEKDQEAKRKFDEKELLSTDYNNKNDDNESQNATTSTTTTAASAALDSTSTSTAADQSAKSDKLQKASELGLTMDKIRELKLKRSLRKKSSVGVEPQENPLGGLANFDDELRPTGDASFREKSEKVTKDIISREKPLKTPVSVLQSNRKNFDKILSSVKEHIKKEKTMKQQESVTNSTTNNKKDLKRKPKETSSRTYDRYHFKDQDVYKIKGFETDLFSIDTHGSFQNSKTSSALQPTATTAATTTTTTSASAASVTSSIPEPPPPPKERKPERRKSDRPSSTPTSSSSGAPAYSSSITSTSSTAPSSSKHSTRINPYAVNQSTVPIIIVPQAPTSLVTISNVKELFIDSQYKPSERNVRVNSIEIERTPAQLAGRPLPIKYRVVNDVHRLSPGDWTKVVAVVAQGQEWQFKRWAKTWETPAEIFSKAKGFYFHFEDERVPDVINQWNVKVFPINKHKRHLDKTAVVNFWKILDQELLRRSSIGASGGGGGGGSSNSSSSSNLAGSNGAQKRTNH